MSSTQSSTRTRNSSGPEAVESVHPGTVRKLLWRQATAVLVKPCQPAPCRGRQYPDTKFQRGRGCCRRYKAPPRNKANRSNIVHNPNLVPGRARPVANPYRWTCFDKRDGEFGEGGLTVARPSLCVTTPHREHQPPRVEEIADPEHDLELLERLREEVVRPGRQRSPLRVERRVCREHKDGDVFAARDHGSHLPQHRDAVQVRHEQVEEDQVRVEPSGRGPGPGVSRSSSRAACSRRLGADVRGAARSRARRPR
jgi:hypothetical protein